MEPKSQTPTLKITIKIKQVPKSTSKQGKSQANPAVSSPLINKKDTKDQELPEKGRDNSQPSDDTWANYVIKVLDAAKEKGVKVADMLERFPWLKHLPYVSLVRFLPKL